MVKHLPLSILRPRSLLVREYKLLCAMLGEHAVPELKQAIVCRCSPGDLGSIAFYHDRKKSPTQLVAEAFFYDVDDVGVVISLYADRAGYLRDLDFWKTDFTPLIRYPRPAHLVECYTAPWISSHVNAQNELVYPFSVPQVNCHAVNQLLHAVPRVPAGLSANRKGVLPARTKKKP